MELWMLCLIRDMSQLTLFDLLGKLCITVGQPNPREFSEIRVKYRLSAAQVIYYLCA